MDAEPRHNHKMNTPNPLIPQGTFPDSRGKSHVRIAVFTIMAIHVVLLSALLMAGCKKTTDASAESTNALTAFEPATNVFVPAPSTTTNLQVTTTQAVNTPPPVPVAPPAVETPAVASAAPAAEREHVIVKDDSFYTLSKQYNVSMRAIAEANPGVDPTRLKIGQKIKIPASSSTTSAGTSSNGSASSSSGEKTYTVKSGDTLWKIAKDHGVTEKALRTANNLKTTQIKVGQKLKIPVSASTPVQAREATNATTP
jgi:LysM repeat protein